MSCIFVAFLAVCIEMLSFLHVLSPSRLVAGNSARSQMPIKSFEQSTKVVSLGVSKQFRIIFC